MFLFILTMVVVIYSVTPTPSVKTISLMLIYCFVLMRISIGLRVLFLNTNVSVMRGVNNSLTLCLFYVSFIHVYISGTIRDWQTCFNQITFLNLSVCILPLVTKLIDNDIVLTTHYKVLL